MAAKGRIATASLVKGSIVVTSEDGYPTQRKTGPTREVVKVEIKASGTRGFSKASPRRYDIHFHDGVVASNLAGVNTWTVGNMVVGGSATKEATVKNAKAAKKAPAKKAPAKKVTKLKVVKDPKPEQIALTTGTRRLGKAQVDVLAIKDPLARMAAMTELIAEARELVSNVSEARVELAQEAKGKGVSYTDLAKAAGMSAGRMAQIASGRKAYTPVAQRG